MSKDMIAVDVDEVLFPFLPQFVGFHNRTYSTNVTPDDFLSYEFENILHLPFKETVERIYAFHEVDDSHVEPLADAKRVLQKLSHDYDLAIITARNPKFETSTKAWIDKNFPDVFRTITLIGYADVMAHPLTKTDICRDIGAFALIDDSLKHISHATANGIEGVLFGDYKWNQADELPAGVTRCKDWAAVLEYFDGR